ncbi:MAG: hypothetical protein KGJ37_03155, partial [Verrucomicrobiota bacterium]|nr:hypothetical protein [Verrucomicrobiota bacterium]
ASTALLTPVRRIKLLWALRSHQAACDHIRSQLGLRPPGEIIARYDDPVASNRALIVIANGLGGAAVASVEGNYPIDHLTHHHRQFPTEELACKYVEKLDSGQADWTED